MRTLALSCVLLAISAVAVAEETATVAVGSGTYEMPKTWVRLRAGGSSLGPIASFGIPTVVEDKDVPPIKLNFYQFAGGGGGVEANIKRWEGMFVAEGLEKKRETVEANGIKITWIDLTGDYRDKPFPASPEFQLRSGYRMLAAIVEIPDEDAYYIRTVGPKASMTAQEKAIIGMFKSVKKK